MELLIAEGHGASIHIDNGEVIVTATSRAGVGALGADTITLQFEDLTAVGYKKAGVLTNGALYLGTVKGKVTVHFLSRSTDAFIAMRDALIDAGIPLDSSIAQLPTYSPKVEDIKARKG